MLLIMIAYTFHTYTLKVNLLTYITHPLANPVYRDEYMGSGSGGAALANMAKNYSQLTAFKRGNHMSPTLSRDQEGGSLM